MLRADPSDHTEQVPIDGGFDVLAGGPQGDSWSERWRSLPSWARVSALGLVVSALFVTAVLLHRSWSMDREASREVRLAVTLGVSSSSTTPLGGQVEYFVTVRNEGRRAVTVSELTSVSGSVRITGAGPLRIDAGTESLLSLSVLLTCGATASDASVPRDLAGTLDGQVTVVRDDGGTAVRPVQILGPEPLLDAASTLCSVRPELSSYELSGPTVR